MKKIQFGVILAMLMVGTGGGFAPWVYRSAVALQLTAPGLAEYVKFLPEARLGQLSIQRLHFLLPLAVVALGLPLVSVNRHLRLPNGVNWTLRLLVLPLALGLLSPVWAPGVLLNDEFRLQTMVAGLAVALTLVAPFFKNLSLKWLLSGLTLSILIGVGLAVRQFYLVNQAIATTYASPIALGWGGWLTIFGSCGLLIITIFLYLTSDKN